MELELKKLTIFLVFLLFAGFSLNARISWEFEIKGNVGYNFVNEETPFGNQQYKDFLFGAGLDVTLCFGHFIGLNLSGSYLPICYTNPNPTENNLNVDFRSGMRLGQGLAIMIPITEKVKVKTVVGYSLMIYNRYNETCEDEYGNEQNVPNKYEAGGFFASLGCVWMPVKHFGLTFGTDIDFNIAEGRKRQFSQSGYEYNPKYTQIYINPFMGGVIRLGRKL